MIRLLVILAISWYIVRYVRKAIHLANQTSSSMPPPDYYRTSQYDKNEIKEAEFTIIDDKKS